MDSKISYPLDANDAFLSLYKLEKEIERLKSELCATQVAFNDWRVMHGAPMVEAENTRLKELLSAARSFVPDDVAWQWDSNQWLVDKIDEALNRRQATLG